MAEGMNRPGLLEEHRLQEQGYHLIAGIDEAGRGAWAGPVYAAAVILPLARPDLEKALHAAADSKQLSPRRREAILPLIYATALGVGIGRASALEVDQRGVVPATYAAMQRAIAALNMPPQALLLDYVTLPGTDLPQHSLPKADQHCLSVAAASIVAKVTRDRWMVMLDGYYRGYGFAGHKGYGTAAHRAALEQRGPCAVHRMSWAPLLKWGGLLFRSRGRQDPT
jgi:ribonuclease HII